MMADGPLRRCSGRWRTDPCEDDKSMTASVVGVKRLVLKHLLGNRRSHRFLEALCIGKTLPLDGGIFRRRFMVAVDVVRVVQIENSIRSSFLLQRNLADVSPPPTKLLGILETFTPRSCWGT